MVGANQYKDGHEFTLPELLFLAEKTVSWPLNDQVVGRLLFTKRVVPRVILVPAGYPAGIFCLYKKIMTSNDRNQVVCDLPVTESWRQVQASKEIDANYSPGASFS